MLLWLELLSAEEFTWPLLRRKSPGLSIINFHFYKGFFPLFFKTRCNSQVHLKKGKFLRIPVFLFEHIWGMFPTKVAPGNWSCLVSFKHPQKTAPELILNTVTMAPGDWSAQKPIKAVVKKGFSSMANGDHKQRLWPQRIWCWPPFLLKFEQRSVTKRPKLM